MHALLLTRRQCGAVSIAVAEAKRAFFPKNQPRQQPQQRHIAVAAKKERAKPAAEGPLQKSPSGRSGDTFLEKDRPILQKSVFRCYKTLIIRDKLLDFGFDVLMVAFAFLPLSLQQNQTKMKTEYRMSAAQLDTIRKTAGRFNEAWTEQEKKEVVALFRDGMRIEEIAHMQGRTKNAIKIRLMNEGEILPYLSRRGQEWSDEETERLGRFYSQGYAPSECAKMLGRISGETREKLIAIGLLEPLALHESPDNAYPNAYAPWSEEEKEQLTAELTAVPFYKETFVALSKIAESHGRSLRSIISRAGKIATTEPDNRA